MLRVSVGSLSCCDFNGSPRPRRQPPRVPAPPNPSGRPRDPSSAPNGPTGPTQPDRRPRGPESAPVDRTACFRTHLRPNSFTHDPEREHKRSRSLNLPDDRPKRKRNRARSLTPSARDPERKRNHARSPDLPDNRPECKRKRARSLNPSARDQERKRICARSPNLSEEPRTRTRTHPAIELARVQSESRAHTHLLHELVSVLLGSPVSVSSAASSRATSSGRRQTDSKSCARISDLSIVEALPKFAALPEFPTYQ